MTSYRIAPAALVASLSLSLLACASSSAPVVQAPAAPAGTQVEKPKELVAIVEEAEIAMIGLPKSNDPSAVQGVQGNTLADEIGESLGAGGLGRSGDGQGAGGTEQGSGPGGRRIGGSHRAKPPQVKMGTTTVTGKLPPEVIQRIVRQNFGRFRFCYEDGLRRIPKLEGTVSVRFVIERDGSVTKVTNNGSTLADESTADCVARAFQELSFPQPVGGIVTVVYPIHFSPGEGAASIKPPASPATPPAKRL